MAARRSIEGQAPLILVIDDNEDNRDLYEQFLEHKGWRVATASDGVLGLERATSLHPDVIVLDLGLPKIDGWEVARRLKGDPNTEAIPVIAVTAHAMGGSKQRALAAGVDAFQTKPFLPQELVAEIERLLRR